MELVERFLKHGLYLRGWQPRTVKTYRQALVQIPELPTKQDLDAWVVTMRTRGVTAGGCNMYIRSVNSYLSWLSEEGLHVSLKVKLLPNPAKPVQPFSDAELRRLLMHKPATGTRTRTWTLVVLLLDTGMRIDEALKLQWQDVDFEQLIIRVTGKGNKQRLVPMSLEGRKHLFRFQQKASPGFVFCTRSGLALTYRNAYRDIKALCRRADVAGRHVHPHAFRHCFAVNYVRRGGEAQQTELPNG